MLKLVNSHWKLGGIRLSLALYLSGAVYHEKWEYERAIHMHETALKYFPEKNFRVFTFFIITHT